MAKLSYVDGAEEFVYVLGHCMINYGGLIGSNLVRGAFSSTSYSTSSLYRPEAFKDEPRETDAPRTPSGPCTDHAPADMDSTEVPPKHEASAQKTRGSDPSLGKTTPGAFQAVPPTVPQTQNKEQDEFEEQIRRMKIDLTNDNSVLDWSDVAGLNSCKTALDEFASFFLHFPHLTRNLRNRSTTGILLFGPQGTGKTLLVKSFAKKYNLSLYDIRASAIMSKFVGDSEKFIKALFKVVRSDTPAVLMLDECDGLLCNPNADTSQSHSYRLLQNEIKNQWSDLMYSRDEVIVIGATNKPHDIDMDGFGRRLSLKLLVDLPGANSCYQILKNTLGTVRHTVDDASLEQLGSMCYEENLSGFDIDTLVEGQLRRSIRSIVLATHFRNMEWDTKTIMIPCQAGDDGAVAGTWTSLGCDPESISYVPLTTADLRGAIQRAKSTVDEMMVQKHVEFASKYGTEMD